MIKHGNLKRKPITPLYPVSAYDVDRLFNLFANNDWDIKKQFFDELFMKFCEMLERLTDDEKNLIITLLEDYLYVSGMNYRLYLRDVLNGIDLFSTKTYSEVYFVPLVSPSDFGYAKSGIIFSYDCQYDKLPSHKGKVISLLMPPLLKDKHDNRTNALIIFLDDYIGTGDTANESLKYYEEHLKKADDEVIVVGLVAQERGLEVIHELGYNTYVLTVKRRGISDSDKIADKTTALQLMDNIEKNLRLLGKFKHGYKQSEALVTMKRTPNNTFPVFWCPNGSNKLPWPAPFDRAGAYD